MTTYLRGFGPARIRTYLALAVPAPAQLVGVTLYRARRSSRQVVERGAA
jgi:hypothetical protein